MTVSKRSRAAHRVSYETFVGPIPQGLQIDHLCRVRNCVNPQHLEPVTGVENVRRGMAATGTIAGKRLGGQQLGDLCSGGHVLDEANTYRRRDLLCCVPCQRERNRLHASGGKPRQRWYTSHAKVAAEARARQGEWVSIATYRLADSANHIVLYVRTGKRLSAYLPAGSFEARRETTAEGFQVFARFVGVSPVQGGVR
jgi:hypothetical protein